MTTPAAGAGEAGARWEQSGDRRRQPQVAETQSHALCVVTVAAGAQRGLHDAPGRGAGCRATTPPPFPHPSPGPSSPSSHWPSRVAVGVRPRGRCAGPAVTSRCGPDLPRLTPPTTAARKGHGGATTKTVAPGGRCQHCCHLPSSKECSLKQN